MIRELIEKKVFHTSTKLSNRQWKLQGKYFVVAIDGTGVNSYSEKHCDKCLTRTYESGKKIYFHNVLEAKLVLPNGLAISLATEWTVTELGRSIENDGLEYDKQDCESKAFKRLSVKLKKAFPRLPICIVGDGLYPNKTVFGICEQNKWEYIITLKNGNLSSVWEEVESLLQLQKENELEVINRKRNNQTSMGHRNKLQRSYS